MLDLDNTLGDRAAAVEAWLDEFVAVHGLDDTTRDWIASLDADGYAPRHDVFDQIRAQLGLDAPADELVAAYRSRIVELTTATVGAHDCLVMLRAAGHRLAIVTNGSSGQQHAKIERLGFAPLVDAVVVSGDLSIKKPDERIFHIAAEQASASLDGAWMVGDSAVHDIAPAAGLGLRTVWIRRGRSWDLDGVEPTHVADTPAEIAVLIS